MSSSANSLKNSFNLDEAAALLKVSRRTVMRQAPAWGSFPGRNGSPRIPRAGLEKLVDLKDNLLRPKDVANMLAVSYSTVIRWRWEGRLRGVKIGDPGARGRALRIYESSVRELLAGGDEGLL